MHFCIRRNYIYLSCTLYVPDISVQHTSFIESLFVIEMLKVHSS